MKYDDRYDLWSCGRCGRILQLPSIPLQSPNCCGTGMWFLKLMIGTPYPVEITDGDRIDRARGASQ